jgi:NitT/TauT family transport system permease protein
VNAYATSKVFVTIVVLVLLGVALTQAVDYLQRRFARWKETERAS